MGMAYLISVYFSKEWLDLVTKEGEEETLKKSMWVEEGAPESRCEMR